jgi:hypothetical protein
MAEREIVTRESFDAAVIGAAMDEVCGHPLDHFAIRIAGDSANTAHVFFQNEGFA